MPFKCPNPLEFDAGRPLALMCYEAALDTYNAIEDELLPIEAADELFNSHSIFVDSGWSVTCTNVRSAMQQICGYWVRPE